MLIEVEEHTAKNNHIHIVNVIRNILYCYNFMLKNKFKNFRAMEKS